MQIKSLNGTIELSNDDRLRIRNSLIKAGIDEKYVRPIFGGIGPRAGGCCANNGDGCDKYHSVSPAALEQLKRAIINKRIDIRKLDAKVVKLVDG